MTQVLSFPDIPGQGGPVRPPDAPASSGAAPDPSRATLSEVWGGVRDAGALGFALAALVRPGPVLWVQDRLSRVEMGHPQAGVLRRIYGHDVIHVQANRVHDALMAMEMGLGCPALSAVLGEVWGAAPRLDFTATKRLALRAEAAGVPCWLIRRGAEPALSAARERWRVTPMPADPDPWDARAPGAPRWRAELFRSRAGRPGTWVARHEPDRKTQAHRLRLAPLAGDGAVVGASGADPQRAAR